MSDKKELIKVVEQKEVLSSAWKDKLAKYAEEAKKFAANSGGGLPFFSLSSGVLKWNGEALPHNTLIAIVLAQRYEHTYYIEKYKPGSFSSPACFAIGGDPDTLKPHENSSNKQNDKCGKPGQKGCCPQNEWSSSSYSDKGKACSNVVRIALLPAGEYVPKEKNSDPENNPILFNKVSLFETEEIGYLRIPVTSVRGFTNVLKASPLPPFAYYTRIKVVSDEVSQFKILFEPVKSVEPFLLDVLERRLKDSEVEIDTPYAKVDEEEQEVDEKEESKKRKF